MSFDWGLFLLLAEELIENQPNNTLEEAYIRTSIGRFYYCIYGFAFNYLLKTTDIPASNKHRFVRDQYKFSNNEHEVKIGENLELLWRKRIKADYVDLEKVDPSEAKISNVVARDTLNELIIIGAIKGD